MLPLSPTRHPATTPAMATPEARPPAAPRPSPAALPSGAGPAATTALSARRAAMTSPTSSLCCVTTGKRKQALDDADADVARPASDDKSASPRAAWLAAFDDLPDIIDLGHDGESAGPTETKAYAVAEKEPFYFAWPADEDIVAVTLGGRPIQALHVGQDEGFLTLPSGGEEGCTALASGFFANCIAIVARSAQGIGLTHTSEPGSIAQQLVDVREEFSALAWAEPELTLVMFKGALREQLARDRVKVPQEWAEICAGMALSTPPYDGDDMEECLSLRETALRQLARTHGADLRVVPGREDGLVVSCSAGDPLEMVNSQVAFTRPAADEKD